MQNHKPRDTTKSNNAYSDVYYVVLNRMTSSSVSLCWDTLFLTKTDFKLVAADCGVVKKKMQGDTNTYRKALHEKVLNIFNGKFSSLSNDTQRNGPVFSRSAEVRLKSNGISKRCFIYMIWCEILLPREKLPEDDLDKAENVDLFQ